MILSSCDQKFINTAAGPNAFFIFSGLEIGCGFEFSDSKLIKHKGSNLLFQPQGIFVKCCALQVVIEPCHVRFAYGPYNMFLNAKTRICIKPMHLTNNQYLSSWCIY